jgi:hypothetical protein
MHITRGTFTGSGSNFNDQFVAEGFQVNMAGRITYRGLVDFSGIFIIEFTTPPSFVGKRTVDITFRRQVLHLTGRLASNGNEGGRLNTQAANHTVCLLPWSYCINLTL